MLEKSPRILEATPQTLEKLQSFVRIIKADLSYRWRTAKINVKWLIDKCYLPLTQENYELYLLMHLHYWKKRHDFPNLVNCRDFNDKLQWLKLFDQQLEIVDYSDKILVRDYVRKQVGENYLVPLYQVHDHFSEIDFDALPNAFVIKTNHDCGTVLLVRDKSKLDYQAAEAKIEKALKQSHGWEKGEWAYSYVQPKVLVEKFITPENLTPPPDYKFFCVDGAVQFATYIYDRGFDTKEQVLNSQGNQIDMEPLKYKLGKNFKRPARWEEMIDIAERLSHGFKFVRIDLFCPDEQIYAGEMTFWPMGGVCPEKGQKEIGKLINFDRTTFKPPILSELEKSRSRFSLYPENTSQGVNDINYKSRKQIKKKIESASSRKRPSWRTTD